MSEEQQNYAGEVAIIGMACRYPGARTPEAFWQNLRNGVESISFFDDADLAHLDPEMRKRPNFVPARGVIDDVDKFDAKLFGLTPMEAVVADPHQRVLLEVAWEALERAGINPDTQGEGVGVFCGSDPNRYVDFLFKDPERVANAGGYGVHIGNTADHLAPRISYLLNLRGPSLPIYTACSTSLVAVHVACQNLLHFECDLALAGGVSVPVPRKNGYLYEEGGTTSPDGHCRAFDVEANGCVLGSGAGLVVLKRMADAMADGDQVLAVIQGSAVNNDGAHKVGYTAPSVEGQRRVIEDTLDVADIDPADISYVEAHGTGTPLGDPIEIEALRQAYDGAQDCLIGSVKTNIGHANAAAGVAGLIKTVLCMQHRTLVPTLHYTQANPKLGLEESPFRVCDQVQAWDQAELKAGISSFGIGGTNAHVVLSSPPPQPQTTDSGKPLKLVTLSAKSPDALAELQHRLAQHLTDMPDEPGYLDDWAYTLNLGRKALDHRTSFVFAGKQQALEALNKGGKPYALGKDHSHRPLVFMFPGQGKHYPDLGKRLYQVEAVFREKVDTCAELLQGSLGLNLAEYLFAEEGSEERARLLQPDLWQPAIFTVEYALAELWRAYGMEPEAMIGHSIGEYVAATLAGVLRLEDGLSLIAERGKQTTRVEEGAMVAVVAPEEKILPYVQRPLALAAVNGPSLCVLSGPRNEINNITQELKQDGLQTIALESSHAFHSSMMEPVMAPLTGLAKTFELGEPQIPYLSNLSGTWITAEECLDPQYWSRHLMATVRFEAGLRTLAGDPARVYLEVGPGKVLAKLAERHPDCQSKPVASMDDAEDTATAFLQALGQLWTRGVVVDWSQIYAGQQRRRLTLPTYPFEQQSFWLPNIEGESQAEVAGEQGAVGMAGGPASETETLNDPLTSKLPPNDWFFLPSWRQSPLSSAGRSDEMPGPWLCFVDGASEPVAVRLEELGAKVIRVQYGDDFDMVDENHFTLDPNEPVGYSALMDVLNTLEIRPAHILHGWCLNHSADEDQILVRGFESLAHITRTFGTGKADQPIPLTILTSQVFQTLPSTAIEPAKATLLGSLWVIPKESSNLACRLVDVDRQPDTDLPLEEMIDELFQTGPDRVALHHGMRWVEDYTAAHVAEEPQLPFNQRDQVLITNPWQELGYALMARLAAQGARLVLADRVFFPKPEEWDRWVEEEGEADITSQRILRLKSLLALGAQIRIHTLSLQDAAALGRLVAELDGAGGCQGVFHLDQPSDSGLIQAKAPQDQSGILKSKVAEANNLVQAFLAAEHQPKWVVLSGENPAEGGLGKAEQGAAYAYLDHLALQYRGQLPLKAVEWGTFAWSTGSEPGQTASVIEAQLEVKREKFGMDPEACIDALARLLTIRQPVVVISTRDYLPLLEQQGIFTAAYFQNQMQAQEQEGDHQRPQLSTEYVAPTTQIETLIVDIWESHFEIHQIGINDNFFELGGHSLLAVQLLSKLKDTFSTPIAIEDFFNAPTIAEMATLVTQANLDEEEAAGLEAMLDEIEGLSENEIEKLLNRS